MIPATGSDPRVLIADEDVAFARALQGALAERGVSSVWAQTAPEAVHLVHHDPSLCLALIDSQISGAGGLTLLQQLHQTDPGLTVVLMSSSGSLAAALEATRRGAADYILKPFEINAMAERISRYQELSRVGAEDQSTGVSPGPIRRLEDFIFKSEAMARVMEQASRAASSDIPVLLVGERGVGKDMLARAIHSASPRAQGPFLRMDCSTELSDPTLRGPAFSEAALRRLFDAASNGTLFLCEVGELPADLQSGLVKFLEENDRGINSGGVPEKTLPRLIASASQSADEIRARCLRPELFRHVAGEILNVPPLRERAEDIAPLTRYFLGRLGQRYNHSFVLSWSGLDLLLHYAFPGNVRELECLLERVATRSLQNPRRLTFGELLPHLDKSGVPAKKTAVEEQPLDLGRVEQLAIERALWFAKGNRTKAAALLGIDRTTLHSKLRRFGKEPQPN